MLHIFIKIWIIKESLIWSSVCVCVGIRTELYVTIQFCEARLHLWFLSPNITFVDSLCLYLLFVFFICSMLC